MVFGTEMFRLLVETGSESFGVDRHLVGTAAKPLDWESVRRERIQGQTQCTVVVHARLERLEEEIALADEVVESGAEGVEGTLRTEARSRGRARDAVNTPLCRHRRSGWRSNRGVQRSRSGEWHCQGGRGLVCAEERYRRGWRRGASWCALRPG